MFSVCKSTNTDNGWVSKVSAAEVPLVLVDSHELMTLHITSSLEQHMSEYCPHSSDRYTQASHSLWKYLSSALLQFFAKKLFLHLL